MNKKLIAKEYILFLKYLAIDSAVLLVLLIVTGPSISWDWEFNRFFCFTHCNWSDFDLLFEWAVLLGPYLIMNMIRSIKWALRNK